MQGIYSHTRDEITIFFSLDNGKHRIYKEEETTEFSNVEVIGGLDKSCFNGVVGGEFKREERKGIRDSE